MNFPKLTYKTTYKNKSLALGASLALHILLVVLAIIYSYFYVQKTAVLENPQKKASSERRATPAPVRVSSKSRSASPQVSKKAPAQQVQKPDEPRKASPQAAVKPAHKTPPAALKKTMPVAQQKPTQKEEPKVVKKRVKREPKEQKKTSAPQAMPKAVTSQVHAQNVFPVARSSGYTTMPRYSSQASHFAYRPRRRRRRRGSSTGTKITPAQFMQAFRNAYRSEQESQSRRDQYAGHSRDAQDAIQQQLNEFKYANYNTKVNEVLESSFSMYSAPIYFDRDIYQQINVSLVIGPRGEVIEVKLVQPTGYDPLDNHIISVIKKSHFAPIPKHLNCDRYAFSLAPWVDVKRGTGTVSYRYMR